MKPRQVPVEGSIVRRIATRIVPVLLALIVLAAAAPAAHAIAANWTWVAKGRLAGNVGSLDAIACPTVRMCVLVDVGSNLWVGTR